MGTRITQHSFAGGELAPDLHARTDVSKYGIGAETVLNGFVATQGGVSNRAGLELVCETKDSSKKSRVIPFSFNTEQTYIIEAGEKYFRFIMDGGLITKDTADSDKKSVVEVETPYSEDDLFMLKYAQNADVLTLCNTKYEPAELSRSSHYNWMLENIAIEPSILPPENLTSSHSGTITTSTDYTYVVTAVMNDTYEESVVSDEITEAASIEAAWGGDEYITIGWDAVDNAAEYNVYRSVNGVYAYSGTSKTTSFKDNNIEPDLSTTAPIYKNPFDSVGNYPATVTYFQQRRVFAQTQNKPQGIFATQTGMHHNFNVSRPLIATDAVTLSLDADYVNGVKHLISMKDGLIAFTSDAEWKVNGSDGVFQATPPPITLPQSYYGCSDIMPIKSGSMILFTQAGGSVVRDLGYTYTSDSYDGNELSVYANHLFRGKQVVDWAYSKEPYRITWAVMSDGTMNALTYDPKQEELGWHHHETDGEFESVAVIREEYEDVPYFVIKRTINGQTKRFIERMKSRIIDDAKDGFFVDCGLSYDGEPVNELTGLEHLEDKEVIILADGGVITDKIVTDGTITLDNEASKIVIGLPYTFDFKTLPFEGDNTQGKKKKISRVDIKIENSREDFFVVGSDGSEEQLQRSIESINDSGLLFNKDVTANPVSDYETKAQVRIKQYYPLPLTILSITPEIEIA